MDVGIEVAVLVCSTRVGGDGKRGTTEEGAQAGQVSKEHAKDMQ